MNYNTETYGGLSEEPKELQNSRPVIGISKEYTRILNDFKAGNVPYGSILNYIEYDANDLIQGKGIHLTNIANEYVGFFPATGCRDYMRQPLLERYGFGDGIDWISRESRLRY